MEDKSYNERLFSQGWRRRLHQARFLWVNRSMQNLVCSPERVIELGCFDGKTIDFLPQYPKRYVGLDANWEGGLDIARDKWKSYPEYEFKLCKKPEDIEINEHFDVGICLETFEHVPEEMVHPYLEKLSCLVDQYIFISVPNEKGLLFAGKYLAKKLAGLTTESYTPSEFFHALTGEMGKIERNEHKGFDYETFIKSVGDYFKIIELSSLPLSWLPLSFGFGISILGKK